MTFGRGGDENYVTVEGQVKAITDLAIGLTLDDYSLVWVPKSVCLPQATRNNREVDLEDLDRGEIVSLEVEEWFAEKEGLA